MLLTHSAPPAASAVKSHSVDAENNIQREDNASFTDTEPDDNVLAAVVDEFERNKAVSHTADRGKLLQ